MFVDPALEKERGSADAHGCGVNALHLLDGALLSGAIGGREAASGDVRRWRLDAHRAPEQVAGDRGITSLDSTPDGLLVVGTQVDGVEVWRLPPVPR